MTGAAGRLEQLTALRFVAALAVMLSHMEFLASSDDARVRAGFDLLARQGYCGVGFFYILSGFIIAHAYGARLTSGEIGKGAYLWRRMTRILPLHWLVIALCLCWIVGVKGEVPSASVLLPNLLLLHSWFPQMPVHFSLNGPSWSLSDEMFFYAMFPLLIGVRPARLIGWAIGGGVAILTAATAVSLSGGGYSPTIEWAFYVNPLTRLLEFIIGIILYRAYRAGVGKGWATTRAEVALLLAVPGTMMLVAWAQVPLAFRYQLAFLPVMTASVLIFAHGQGAVSRWLRHPLLVLLGHASFALYLTHRPVVIAAGALAGRGTLYDLLLMLALMALCIVASVVVYRGFEQPVQAWLRRRRDQMRPPHAAKAA